jgi:hypothetical protein
MICSSSIKGRRSQMLKTKPFTDLEEHALELKETYKNNYMYQVFDLQAVFHGIMITVSERGTMDDVRRTLEEYQEAKNILKK